MYSIDYARMATLGRATNLQKRVHAAVLEVNQVMIDALRPGLTCSELHRIGLEAMGPAGVERDAPSPELGRMGHGQGMLITEPPSVTPGDHTVLEPGMVISTEPGGARRRRRVPVGGRAHHHRGGCGAADAGVPGAEGARLVGGEDPPKAVLCPLSPRVSGEGIASLAARKASA